MVLIQRSGVLGLLLLVGCGRWHFDTHGASADGGADDSCAASSCIADAAADFNGTSTGAGGNWRYLDDHRDRTWAAMTASAGAMTGAEPGNYITTCAAHPGAPACGALPGALLVSTAGRPSTADPAIEFKTPDTQVIKLSLHAYLPSGDPQTIRLYRNSREDVLFTGVATAGAALERGLTLDALAGDRFLVAVEPTMTGATDIGLQLFVSASNAPFPSSCQLAVPFLSGPTTSTPDLCSNTAVTHFAYPTSTPLATQLVVASGPFPELGLAASIPKDEFLQRDKLLDWSGDMTVQLWVKLNSLPSTLNHAWLFDDFDFDLGGGLGLSIAAGGGTAVSLDVTACTDTTTNPVAVGDVFTPYPTDGGWHFMRVVRTGGNVLVCLDGDYKTSLAVQAALPPGITTYNPPRLGKDHLNRVGAFFDGRIDDVRVFTGALPCK